MTAPWKFKGGGPASLSPITAIEFDPKVELLWTGDSYGVLTSFRVQPHGETTEWTLYSSFSASNRPISGIFYLDVGEENMVTVADREVIRGFKRGGLPVMCMSLPPDTQNYIDLFQANRKARAMYFTGNAGLTKMVLHEGDTEQRTVPNLEDSSTIVALKQSDDWVATGSASGSVVIRSSSDLASIGHVTPSRNRVMALDVFDNTIVAAFSERSTMSFAKVYDVRKLGTEVFTVGSIPSGNITQMRRYQDSFGISRDRAFVLTAQGFHIIQFDQEKPVFSSCGVIEGSCTAVSVSQSSMCAAIGSDKGSFYALAHPATHDDYIMSTYEQPDKPVPPSYQSGWKEMSAASGFDETIATSTLASTWPEEDYIILTVPQKLRCATNVDSDGIVPNQWGLVRADSYLTDPKDKLASVLPNPYPFNTQLGSDSSRVQELLQELRKDMKRKHKVLRGGNTEYDPMDDALQVCYGVQHRIDWRTYNELPQKVIGLDNSFPECWITPLLQSLYLCQPPEFPIRKVIVRHLCTREFCMTCEIAFIFNNMIVTAASNNGMREAALPPIVQVGNLIRTMRQLRAFTASEVFTRPKNRDDAVTKMHTAQRLVLETLHRDLQDQKAYSFPGCKPPAQDYDTNIASLFGTEFTSNGRVHVEPRFFWDVPASALKVDEGLQHLLKQLEAYKDQVQIKRLPPIIVLLLNPEHGNLKPPTSLKISRAGKEDYNYVLNSNIVHLADDVDDRGNFVSHQRIKEDNFCLVNDYRVTSMMKMQELERLIPAMRSYAAVVTFYALDQLTAPPYARNDERPLNMWEILGPLLTNDVLARPLMCNVSQKPFKSPLKDFKEIHTEDLVAIDAEYVVLKWDSRDDAPDFYYSPQKKSHMGLARVSCLLSTQEGDERTIVDDYVHIPETIDDYVTQFSGIHPGDLDPVKSSKSLTSFKSTYLKLRALVDAGVIFVGHGLAQDFRVCNIAVPKRQIIDTLEIFHVKGGRFLSLRFLAYHVLGESVQEDEHDSVEDARTSLRLYRKYTQLKREGVFDSVLDHLMAKGAETSWYVPERGPAFRGEPMTPPASLMGSPVFKHGGVDGKDDAAAAEEAAVAEAEEETEGLFEAVRRSVEEEESKKSK